MGGAEQVILALGERLPQFGVEASFALLRPGPLEKIAKDRGLAVHVFPEEYRYRDIGSVRKCIGWLADRIRDDKADILHSNLTAHFVGGWAARKAKVPELWHLHDYPFHFDIVHAISQRVPTSFAVFTTKFLESGEPLVARRPHAVVHPNCVDIEKIQATPGDPAVRERLGIGPGPYFLTVTRLQEHKGHPYLIDAAAKIAGEFSDVRWVIAGKAKGEEQETYFKSLQDQVKAKGLEGRVLFPGFIRDEDLVPLFREATALVHPAVTEGYGLVLMEAMAADIPVIAAAASGPAEIITDGINGLLAPVRDPDGLAAAMKRLLTDKALAAKLRTGAAADIANRSVVAMTRDTAAIYRQMLGTR